MNLKETERMRALIAQINAADTAYYKEDRPVMSDRDYDKLMDELKQLESETGVTLAGSPTQTVPSEILEELTPVRHTRPMLSADKTKSVEDLLKFKGNHRVVVSWKLDGLTLVLRYANGKLAQAITRGAEGRIGEDVTHTVKTFLNVPLTVPASDSFEVRGEGVISWENFNKINLSLEDPYTHPRNLAAGSTRKLDANEARKRMLEFFAFDLISDNPAFDNKTKQFEFLRENGFCVVPNTLFGAYEDDEEVRNTIAQFNPKEFAYPVDGLIMEYEDVAYGRSLGATGHHENRLIALKWQDELFQTKFLGVELATTRTGMVSLTGILEPVEIDGTIVSRAYLHNLDIFDSFDFGIGDTVTVYKSNMIIPQIAENLTQSNTYELPKTCPCCGEPITVKKTTGGTRMLFCDNPHCAAKLVKKFVHFCDKTRMDIEGLSDSKLETLISHGWVKNFGDLYDLEKHHDEIVSTEGFGEKSFERMQAAIDKSRKRTLAQFIAGLGIPTVGRHAGRDLSEYFNGSWAEFEAAILNGFDFTTLPDFGKTMNDNIYKWYADADEAALWRPLLRKIGFIKENENMNINVNRNTELMGKTVVVTGKLMRYTRNEIQLQLIGLGATPASSVTKKTDYVIYGDKPGSKLTKAMNLGIRTLSEEEFEDLIKQ